MIALWQDTPDGVTHVGDVPDRAAAIARLRRTRVPCVAFDGIRPVAASGATTTAARDRIVAAAAGAWGPKTTRGQARGKGGGIPQSCGCTWPGCAELAAPFQERLAEFLRPFCRPHRQKLQHAKAVTPGEAHAVIARLRGAA